MICLSIIIPVYNGEEYIEKCFKSIRCQTFRDYEVLCINDGSTDGSLEICEELSKMDSRFKVFTKPNGGVASARQFGINVAIGKYITFIDSDDWIEPNMYQEMFKIINQYDADIVTCNYVKDYERYSESMSCLKEISKTPFSGEKLIQYAFQREEYKAVAAFLWNKVFRATLFNTIEHSRFELQRGDDVVLLVDLALHSTVNLFCDQPLYHYTQRQTSITHTKSVENLDKLEDILVGYKISINTLEKNHISQDIIIWLKRFHCYHASVLAELAYQFHDQHKQKMYQEEMRIYLEEYIETNKDNTERINRINKIMNF